MEDKNVIKFVGLKIREYRKKNGWTQKELGKKVGLKHNTIANYELGRNAPEQNMIFKISRALGVTVDDLFPTQEQRKNDLEHALMMVEGLEMQDINILNRILEKTLSLKGEDRERFLDGLNFTVDYHDRKGK